MRHYNSVVCTAGIPNVTQYCGKHDISTPLNYLIPIHVIIREWTWNNGEVKQFQISDLLVIINRTACPCSAALRCKLLLCRNSNVTHAINRSWVQIFPVQAFLICSIIPAQCAVAMGDPDQGQLSWDHQDPSDKNVDCNEWKHWNGSGVGGMLCWNDWPRSERVRTNLLSGRCDPQPSSLVPVRP